MKVFIDGRAGTTGLRIYERLAQRPDVTLLNLSEEERKVTARRKEALNACDIAFLCLPDAAAKEAVSLIENPAVRVLDASTAHRTNADWAYGFPELSVAHWEKVKTASRVAIPGCHASGFIALVYPLIAAGLLDREQQLQCHSLTGYTGGGKGMIAQYEADGRTAALDAPRLYGINQNHKHLPEMKAVTGLQFDPVFCPIVADFPCGMLMTVPLSKNQLNGGVDAVKDCLRQAYSGSIVRFCEAMDDEGFISANGLAGSDAMEIAVAGNEERILLMARYDNLGKGASGAALECMNILTGNGPSIGLSL